MILLGGKRFLVHGHRGSRGTHPENTLAAFAEALNAGVDYIELDVHLSKDEIPIVIHDSEITDRHYPVRKPTPVSDLTASDLEAIEAGSVRQPAFPHQKLSPNQKIPTLEKVFEWREQSNCLCEINVELKREGNQPPASLLVRRVLEVAKRYNALATTLFQSFDYETLMELKRQIPTGIRAALFEEKTDYISRAQEVGAQYISPEFTLVTESLVRDCHTSGLKVVPWTVNTGEDWDKLIAMGVDGIITDYPRHLIQKLRK